MRVNPITLTIAVVLGAASPVMAQQHHPAGTGMPGHNMALMHCGGAMTTGEHAMPGRHGEGGMQGMMEMMGPPGPALLLHHKEQLGLDATQVTRLETLHKEAQPACVRHLQLATTAHREANQLLDGATPDFAAYTARLKEATAHLVEGHLVMAKAAVAARDILAAAQRERLKKLMEEMHKE
jgi:hypothetical protein